MCDRWCGLSRRDFGDGLTANAGELNNKVTKATKVQNGISGWEAGFPWRSPDLVALLLCCSIKTLLTLGEIADNAEAGTLNNKATTETKVENGISFRDLRVSARENAADTSCRTWTSQSSALLGKRLLFI